MTKKYSKSLLDTKISICILSFNVNIHVQAAASYQRQVSDGDYEQVVKELQASQLLINNKNTFPSLQFSSNGSSWCDLVEEPGSGVHIDFDVHQKTTDFLILQVAFLREKVR